ncbi:aggregation-promoting factor C-terminal-like domain-containing protein [Agromyces silvae]|uniref:aggregation-promoting factor C-terminal-like domain-containing protein n=1 Tax=Agromyces silvae TaxID=3388266 RepID=UPI00280B9F5E|nr:lytic transglycosylase domain-containing protein [Agromyces protaetiae]
MQNQTPSSENSTSVITVESATAEPATRSGRRAAQRAQREGASKRRGPLLVAGAIVAVGALTGTGFAVQSAVGAQNERIAHTSALVAAANPDRQQAESHSMILDARAAKVAEDTLSVATDTIAAASGKTDAAALSSSVASLGEYKRLDAGRVFSLAKETSAHAEAVKGQIAEFDRVAAEQAAAEAAAKAAAEAEAAAKAAAERAAATPSAPAAPANPSGAQAIARDLMAAQYGWGEDQFACLVALWSKESGWNVSAENRSSGAYGIPQALPGSKMASAGADWQTNPATQITWGLGYIAGRYGTPCGAWNTSQSQGWY